METRLASSLAEERDSPVPRDRPSTAQPSDNLTRRVTFQAAGGGTMLQGVLHLPQEDSGTFSAAVICHPHPLMGGTMNNGIVVRLCLELAAAGWAALRFDFRGAGDSPGTFDQGVGEMDDVQGAVDFLLAQAEVDAEKVVAIGYSFGAGVALRHAVNDHRLTHLVGIALVRHHYDDPFLDGDPRPKLFVAGDADSWAPLGALRGYVERLESPRELHVVRGAGHLFSGRVDEVASLTVDWLTG